MKYELSQEFFFDAAHTLDRTIETEGSKCIHGHTYHSRVTISGTPDKSGMVLDLGILKENVNIIKEYLDHKFLNELTDLPTTTLESLCVFIWEKCQSLSIEPIEITVERRASGDRCILRDN
jgi:6-pyruvoyltetrahydropterin/6-carboxytetrahydropterin synthase